MESSCNICSAEVRDAEESHICGVPICEQCGEDHLQQINKELEV